YRRVVVAVFALTTAAMMIQGYTSLQLYQAQAQIMSEAERARAVPGLTNTENVFYEDPEPYYNTQYRILKGRDLTRRVVRKLNLATVPEFNGTAAPPSTPITIVRNLRQRVLDFIRPKPSVEEPHGDESADESAMVSGFV